MKAPCPAVLLLLCSVPSFAASVSDTVALSSLDVHFTRGMAPFKEIDIGAGGDPREEEVIADISLTAPKQSPTQQLRGLQLTCALGSGRSTYVSATDGDDTAKSGSDPSSPYRTIQYAVDNHEPCETIHVMSGTYYNDMFGSGQNHYKAVVNLSGVSDGLTIKAYSGDASRPRLRFDGPGGFVCNAAKACSNIDISGLEIEGPSAEISYTDAMANRNAGQVFPEALVRYMGWGVAIWRGHHISLSNMVVHHCPGSGIKVKRGDYIKVTDSVVCNNTWWSPRASSAIDFAESLAVDTENKIKMTIARNEVYGNVNRIPYYNPVHAWNYSTIGGGYDCNFLACNPDAPEFVNTLVDCPWQCRYANFTQNYIIDGVGVYLTWNKATYHHGWMLLENNTCYGNGITGLNVHRTDRVYVRRNTIHSNGVVPRLDMPEAVVEDWHASASGMSRQKISGLVLNHAEGVKLWENKVAARYDEDYAFRLVFDAGVPAGGANKVCKGLVDKDLLNIVKVAKDAAVCGLHEDPPSLVDAPVCRGGSTLLPKNSPLKRGKAICIGEYRFGVTSKGELSLFKGDEKVWGARTKRGNLFAKGDRLKVNKRGIFFLKGSTKKGGRRKVLWSVKRCGAKPVKMIRLYRDEGAVLRLLDRNNKSIWNIGKNGKESGSCA